MKAQPSSQAPAQAAPVTNPFIETMEGTMGSHLHAYQKQTLVRLYQQALKERFPRSAMESLINNKINQPDGWGADKAAHIKRNLLSLFPEPLDVSPSKSILEQLAETPINAQGDCLICFYKTGPTEFLGNFAPCPSGIVLWRNTFQCAEAAFQWRKYFLAAQQNNRIDMLQDPKMNEFFTCDGEAAFQLRKYFDQQYPKVFVTGWQSGKRDEVMWEVLQAKFAQNPAYRILLEDTKSAYLLEHNQAKRDDYWSDNHDGSGKNMLGKMLMAIRNGTPCPPPGDTSGQDRIRYVADYANQPGALSYQIF